VEEVDVVVLLLVDADADAEFVECDTEADPPI